MKAQKRNIGLFKVSLVVGLGVAVFASYQFASSILTIRLETERGPSPSHKTPLKKKDTVMAAADAILIPGLARPVVQTHYDYSNDQLKDRRVIGAASTFNEVEYMQMYPEVASAVRSGSFTSPADHYWQVGARRGMNPNLFFDEADYLDKNPDVAQRIASGELVSGFQHFQLYGLTEGRKYRPVFDEVGYLKANPEVAQAVASGEISSGLVHYLRAGRQAQIDVFIAYASVE